MAERETIHKGAQLLELPVAASTKIELGKMVAVASGYAAEAADTAGHVVMGVAEETVDNTAGANGDVSVRVRRKRAFLLANSGTAAVTAATLGASVYVEDSETVALGSGPTNDIAAGKCLGVETDGVWVEIG